MNKAINHKQITRYLENVKENTKENIIRWLLMDKNDQNKKQIMKAIREFNKQYPKKED